MTGNWRGPRMPLVLLGVVLAASVGCSLTSSHAPARLAAASERALSTSTPTASARTAAARQTAAPAVAPATLPPVTGGGVRALWQGAPWGDLTFDGGLVLGISGSAGQRSVVHAIAAATSRPRWSFTLPSALPSALGLVLAGRVVLVEAGPPVASAGAGGTFVSAYVALDAATGRVRWSVPVGGADPSPPVAVAGNYLLTGDGSGAVTGRETATGRLRWRDPRPSACGRAPGPAMAGAGLGLAADGPLAGASFSCGSRLVVQRLDPATGGVRWTWRSPPVGAGDNPALALTGAARDGGLLLVTGQVGPAPAARRLTTALPRAYSWPQALGPADGVSTVLALAAADGRPRWTELGGQQVSVAVTAGAVCELVSAGAECRDDVTGIAAMPDLLTGRGGGASPPFGSDGFAGATDGLVAAVVGRTAPAGGEVQLRVLRVHGGATIARARVWLPVPSVRVSNYQVFAVAAGPLGPRTVLVLLRRTDLTDAGGFPVLALAVGVPGR